MSERDYLKGVPLRLGKTFYPLARPQFKDIDIHIPLDALQDEYDFGLEKVVIEAYDSYHEEKARLLKKAEERRKEEEKVAAIEKERLERLRLEAEEARKEQEEKQRLEELAAAEAAAKEKERKRAESEPLKPQPQRQYCRTDAASTDRSASPVTSTLIKVPSSNWTKNVNLNLSDFESDTGNPYDTAEMNSINDKAELASIWANNTDFSGANIISTPVPSDESKYHHPHPHPQNQQHQGHSHMNGTTTPVAVGQVYYPSDNGGTFPPWQPSHPQQWNPSNRIVSGPYNHPGQGQGPSVTTGGSSVPSTSASAIPLAPHTAAATTSTSTLPPLPTSAASSVNSFTKIHFPFLTNYTQTSRERAAERSYHQQFNSVPRPLQQQQFPPSPSTTGLPGSSGIGNDQIIPGSTINTTPSQNYGFGPPGNWPVPAAHHFPTNK